MTSLELRSWTLVCDAPGCTATAAGHGYESWPEGWDSYFIDDAAVDGSSGLLMRDAVRHACPDHAARPGPVALATSCRHEWSAVVPALATRECSRCRDERSRRETREQALRRALDRVRRPLDLVRPAVVPVWSRVLGRP